MGSGSYPPRTGSLTASADRYLRSDGTVLHYRDEGHGPAVLLAHGWTLDLDLWEPQVESLHSSFRIVRFDRRGFGLSTGQPSVSADAQDALALCDSLQLRRIACVGMSQGARLVLDLCRRAPELLSCIVLDGPPDLVDSPGEAQTADVPLTQYRQLIAREGMESFRRCWETHPLMQLRTDDTRSRQLLRRMIARYPARDLLQEPPPLEERWETPPLASLRTPCLVITGEHDLPGRRRAADRIAGLLPLAERAVISGAGHLPNLDHPQQYNAVLRAFLERHTVIHV